MTNSNIIDINRKFLLFFFLIQILLIIVRAKLMFIYIVRWFSVNI